MVHISLPHRSKEKSKQAAGDLHPEQHAEQRPGPSRSPSSQSTIVNGGEKPLILKIYVIRARNLAAKDKSGTSDPYLVVNLGTSKQSTPTISKNLNPEWKICFDMPLVGVPLVECICWDRDRWGKDYMGEFDIAVEDIFSNGKVQQEPKWHKLRSKRSGSKKKTEVSGEVQLQFSLIDSANAAASPEEIYKKFRSVIAAEEEDDLQLLSRTSTTSSIARQEDEDEAEAGADLDEDEEDEEDATETDTPTKAGTGDQIAKKKQKKKRLARLRRKSIAVRAYEFTGKDSDVSGILFMEISKITDLPPERNVTKTGFDMDPFVVTSLGRKVLRTKCIRHNLNPIYNEKMVFQVMKHETNYSISFSVIDRDKLSGNDFVASTSFPIQKMIQAAPEEDPETGLFRIYEQPEWSAPPAEVSKKRFRLPLSRTASASSLKNLGRTGLKRDDSQLSLGGLPPSPFEGQVNPGSLTPGMLTPGLTTPSNQPTSYMPTSAPADESMSRQTTVTSDNTNGSASEDPDMIPYTIPLEMKNKEKWESKHSPQLFIRAKYLPYTALRQQFWRAMLRQYDTDDSGRLSKIELTTMLDTLGSTLHESTIDGFFERYKTQNEAADNMDLTFDQAVICLEEQLQVTSTKKTFGEKVKGLGLAPYGKVSHVDNNDTKTTTKPENSVRPATNEKTGRTAIPTISQDETGAAGEEGKLLEGNDLADEGGEEHIIEIRECPICHQPKLNKRSDADIITHIATCASSDWRQVNNLVMGGFVTASQAQRKWYSKVITKISYGGYKLGANSANILVQDRLTGQINEERMSVYVRLGIRLLYKALGSREMEKKRIKKMLRSLSIKQGKKYDDPASASQIQGFINFHRLDMSEVLRSTEDFKNFNDFFYRQLKPDARPCSAPDDSNIIVSPADSRSVVFNTMDDATRIWVKGRDYSVEKLLGDAYPLDAKHYKGGSLGIFRLAPQDYHRFHVPVDGVLGTPKEIPGEYYTVNPMAIRSALDVYGDNVRVVVPIESVRHGRVMFVCIGAMMVGSTVITRRAGEKVKRAEELGFFKFGGSTVLLLFEPGVMVYDDDLVANSSGALETLVRVGMSIGHHPSVGSWKPDMKKDEKDITNEDRQEAKRRIEGSLAPEGESVASESGAERGGVGGYLGDAGRSVKDAMHGANFS